MKYLVIFHTFSGVLYLEKYMKKQGIEYETMPAPRELSVDCGVALTFVHDDFNKVIGEIHVENIHRIYEVDANILVYENN
ncbi:DUF3343 domain-containing protein [Acidaminobacter sp. JC074]|uniref:DUF3343 domain-containing protein n=1 Tax=Acidaminobacter sp. JC074 TaxID=2530199 RepID=UPI001F0F663E|nr:DUF3343 domain-containing protein [Acidaminobacter sp. JC074]MCH4889939.1 DUF3343 domain-containing protein [Acidaminobacter sp. JC074]